MRSAMEGKCGAVRRKFAGSVMAACHRRTRHGMERAEKRLGNVCQRHCHPTATSRHPVLTAPLYELPQPVWLQGAGDQKYFQPNDISEGLRWRVATRFPRHALVPVMPIGLTPGGNFADSVMAACHRRARHRIERAAKRLGGVNQLGRHPTASFPGISF